MLRLVGSVGFVWLLVFSFDSLFTAMKWFICWLVTVSLNSGPRIFIYEKATSSIFDNCRRSPELYKKHFGFLSLCLHNFLVFCKRRSKDHRKSWGGLSVFPVLCLVVADPKEILCFYSLMLTLNRSRPFSWRWRSVSLFLWFLSTSWNDYCEKLILRTLDILWLYS